MTRAKLKPHFVPMLADPEASVDVRAIIEHLTGRRRIILTLDQWEDMQEQIADMLEQFLAAKTAGATKAAGAAK